ncbi:hypothetical protein C1645_828555 [Glomus cerebriforme]|uniref:Uncharacterized protein n=1 Tax=Glomus cerebriforme TaxID=658196 RepID=A0A397SLK3_9GLOM|nr:hypothetical protein C1645_828555 [Glomus cerebriforme]
MIILLKKYAKIKLKSKKKKLSGCFKHINAHTILNESSSKSSSSNNNVSSNENELEINTLVFGNEETYSNLSKNKTSNFSNSKNKTSKISSTKKNSKDIKLFKIPKNNITLNAFFAILYLPCEICYLKRLTSTGKYLSKSAIDSDANCSKDHIKLLEVKIDKNKIPSIKWYKNSLESISTGYYIFL